MSKGGVIVVVGVGVAVVLIGGVALAATSSKPVTMPNLAPPPPPPPLPSLGSAIVNGAGSLYDEANKNPIFRTYTGGQSFKDTVKDWAINPYYSTAKGAKNLGKKIIGSIF
jgi:hypothetical protein